MVVKQCAYEALKSTHLEFHATISKHTHINFFMPQPLVKTYLGQGRK